MFVEVGGMKQPLDSRKLQTLCERVVRVCKGVHGDALPIAKDHCWAELGHSAIPELLEFLLEEPDERTDESP